MRPIDADRLLKTIANLDVECVDQKQASIMLNTVQKVFPQIVNDEPTLEVEPVIHGRCIVDNEGYERCSVCNEHETGMGYFSRCPRCGARLGW